MVLSGFLVWDVFFCYITGSHNSFRLDCELNKFDVSSLTRELTFSDQNKIDLNFQHLISFGTYVFWALNMQLKISLYQEAVCSLITYGCETKRLDEKTLRKLNSVNIIMLSRITGNCIPHAARPATTSHNLVRAIRKRRYKFLDYILRSGPNRLIYSYTVYRPVVIKYESQERGSIRISLWMPPYTHHSRALHNNRSWTNGQKNNIEHKNSLIPH